MVTIGLEVINAETMIGNPLIVAAICCLTSSVHSSSASRIRKTRKKLSSAA